MKTFIFSNILFLTLICYVSPIFSQSKTIKGQIVSDEKKKNLSKAKISVIIDGICIDSTYTDKTGIFILENLQKTDTLNLRIDKRSYTSKIYEGIVLQEIDTDLGILSMSKHIDIKATRCVWKSKTEHNNN